MTSKHDKHRQRIAREQRVNSQPDDQLGRAPGADFAKRDAHRSGRVDFKLSHTCPDIAAAILTGGADRPYAFGLATALIARCKAIDLIGNDDLDCAEFYGKPGVTFLNIRGDQSTDSSLFRKISRVAAYYARLIRYAWGAQPRIFHILWNNKFESFDRTLLTIYYKWLGKKIVLTVHNVNAAKRDANDTRFNRFTLRIQYRLADHLLVHTEKMKEELIEEFGVGANRVTVIPFGINNAVPRTHLSPDDARRRLGIRTGERTLLFFGNIAPYKGLEYLIAAFRQILDTGGNCRLIIAGRPKNCEGYWKAIQRQIQEEARRGEILLRAAFIPDEETEIYFKAADVLVLPYKHIYQSGVLFLGHSFGLPVLAADVGSLKEEIVEGRTGFLFKSEDPTDLATAINRYFESDLYAQLQNRRQEIQELAMKRHSWEVVAQLTVNVYSRLQMQASSATAPGETRARP
ncbi:MAG TPA: glycosyltransferase family 4 protein [Bryobacteraceae bacterium]|jgi:glycosyltransferase involved in cell wall biosynthesis|nr:glycosyltransferase family 4 protein [Bryobacteraceae bacterium]